MGRSLPLAAADRSRNRPAASYSCAGVSAFRCGPAPCQTLIPRTIPPRRARDTPSAIVYPEARSLGGGPMLATTLYNLLTTGASLLATGAAGEFAKGAGKAAFEALQARLVGEHQATSVARVADAAGDPACADAIRADLARPGIAEDAELRRLARTLEAAIAALPAAETAPYAVEIREIKAGKNLLFEDVEGVRADTATAEGDMTFKGVNAPPGKPAARAPSPRPRRPSTARRSAPPMSAAISTVNEITVETMLAVARGMGYRAPEDLTALQERADRAEADAEALRRERPDLTAEVNRAIAAANHGDPAAAPPRLRRGQRRLHRPGRAPPRRRGPRARRAGPAQEPRGDAPLPLRSLEGRAPPDRGGRTRPDQRLVLDRVRPRPHRPRRPRPRPRRVRGRGAHRASRAPPMGPRRRPRRPRRRARRPRRPAAGARGLRGEPADRAAPSPPATTGNAGWARDVSVSLDKVGDVRVAQGDLPGALEAYEESLRIRRALAARDTGNAGWARDVSVSLSKVGDVRVAQGDLPRGAARQPTRRACGIARDPRRPRHRATPAGPATSRSA